jgi:hypothetical protein
MRRLHWFAMPSVLFVALASAARAGDVPRDFAQKYGPAVRKLQQYYTHATANGTVLREYPKEDKAIEQTFEYRADGMNYRLDTSISVWRRKVLESRSRESYLATPTASFYGWGKANAKPIDDSKELSYEETKARIEKIFPFNQPFSFSTSGTLLELLNRPGVNVGKLSKMLRDGQEMVKINFGEPDDVRDRLPGERAWIVLSPKEGWVVREYYKVVGRGAEAMTYHGAITYSGGHDGVPIIDRLENWQEKGPKRDCLLHEVVSISRFVHGDPSWVDFTADGF